MEVRLHSSQSSADTSSDGLALALQIILPISIAVILLAVLIYVLCIRRRSGRPPCVEYFEVPAKQTVDAPAVAPSEESTNAAASTVAGSAEHAYVPTARRQQPFDGFLTTP